MLAIKNLQIKNFITIFFILVTFSSCKKFVELGPPPTQTDQSIVFASDPVANSAILGLYSSSSPLTSFELYYSVVPGMSADDVQFNTLDSRYDEFKNDEVSPLNSLNENNLWASSYLFLKNTNFAINGLTASQTLSPAVKDQLLGEAKFLRAYTYFYLVNLYGDVPITLSNDPLANATLPRSPAADVWALILKDLTEAQASLPAAYTGASRARINKLAATALLARVYLYKKDWANAETQAAQVINSGIYSLASPANAFINTSNEIIWQIASTTGVSTFGANYIPAIGSVPNFILYDTIYNSFEPADLRKINWTGVTQVGGKNYYYVNKYKVKSGSGNEYNIVLRLAELLLIRAEARAQQNNISSALTDVNVIRSRAGLPALDPALTQAQLLLAIEQERKVELFGEWGHRWLDLKRTNRADAVIGVQKPATWKPTSVLYPIPDNQRILNPTLTQNPGY